MPRRRRIIQSMEVNWYGDDFMAIIDRHGDAALFAAGELLRGAAITRAPRHTGKLAASGYVSTATRSSYTKRRYWRREIKPAKGGAIIAFTAPHAHLIESGRRRAGVIKPRRRGGKRALMVGGAGVVRASSRYKRSAARPFVGPALDASRETMASELASVLRRQLESGLK
jgi:hypothetical protein